MICPSKTCGCEIDDDSRFCDQCGALIRICPACGFTGTGKFCPKDGQKLQPRDAAPGHEAPETRPAPAPGATVRMDIGDESALVLKLRHSSGVELTLRGGDLLGKKEGPHAAFLSGFKYISGRHAEVGCLNGSWSIRDLNSTNKTRVNGSVILPENDTPMKTGDSIHLADQEFTVA